MSQAGHRFECVLEPWDLWMIWDNQTELPAEVDGIVAIGLERDLAVGLCTLLNQRAESASGLRVDEVDEGH